MDAISTFGVTLMHNTATGTPATWAKLIDIKDFPDLGGAPEMLETTTLSDPMQTYIAGIQMLSGLEFTTNYNKTDFDKLKALEGDEEDFAVFFGVDGAHGKFGFSGQLSVFPVGGGVNAVVDMKINIAPSKPITAITI